MWKTLDGPNIPITFLPTNTAAPSPVYHRSVWLFTKNIPLWVEPRKLVTQFIGQFTINKIVNLSMVRLNPPNHVHIHQARWSSGLYILTPGLGASVSRGMGRIWPQRQGNWVSGSFILESLIDDVCRESPDIPTGSFSSSLFAFPGWPWLALLLSKHIFCPCHHSTWSISTLINCSIKAYCSLHSLPVYCQPIVVNQGPKELRIFNSFFDSWSYKREISCGFNYLVSVVSCNVFPLLTKN